MATTETETETESYGVDLTPTWRGILPALIMVLENGSNEGRDLAKDELRRMAHAADQWNEHCNATKGSK